MAILETDRLLLRRLEPGDLDALARLYADPEIRRHFPERTRTRAETKAELDWFVAGDPEHPELGLWATILKADGVFIGRCGLIPWVIDGRPEVEVAYLIDSRYWRRGLGAEAATALVRYGFATLGLRRIVAFIAPEHRASIATAERAGLRFERDVEIDGLRSVCYAIEQTAEGTRTRPV